ncbi:hypothetical protein [Streptomyces griseocarneus]|uniref:hypothetical protein n=1 Tax=Streptomyces griseocarneus TaxID=51201 RepID=UPI001987166D|nr:hypothetical protein [Streptomyces griseocarneus]MBZ6477511.1 hypothetical protein [Streptomyces griseocarneus]GHG82762.1 hypothetical protein GCM10018779_65680 [Streptomyces griseocarneus]
MTLPERHPDTLTHHPVPITTHTDTLMPVQPGPLPAVQTIRLPDGRLITGYALTQPEPPTTLPIPAPAPVPAWAKTTALLAPTVGGGMAAAGFGLSYAAPGLIAMSQALWSAAALIIAAVLTIPLMLRSVRSRTEAPTQITQHITTTGLFGRANGTINHH